MPAARVVVVGSLNLDLLYGVPHLPRPGETLLGTGLTVLSGGKGGNQAHAAAKIARTGTPDGDVSVAMIACVGDDEAAVRLRADLEAVGVDVSGIRAVAGPSGTALIAVDEAGENTIVVIPGANGAWPADLGSIQLTAADVVVLQLEIPFEVVEAVVARSSSAGARVVLNAAPLDRRAAALLPHVAVLVVNEIEASELFGLEGELGADSVAGISSDGGGSLVVTLGARGMLVAPAGGPVEHVAAYPVEALDTVGAGDAFVGGLAAALAAGAPLSVAARWGAAAGALTTTVPGARHPGLDRAAVEGLAGPLG